MAEPSSKIWTDNVAPFTVEKHETPSLLQITTKDQIENVLSSRQETLIKAVIRNHNWPVDHPIRAHLWNCLCRYHCSQKRTEGLYGSLLEECIGTLDCPKSLPSFVDPAYCMSYHLSPGGKRALFRVLCVLNQAYPQVTYSPLIYPLATLFLHYFSEEQVYHCLADILQANGVSRDFLAIHKRGHDIRILVLMKLAKKFVKPFFLKFPPEKRGSFQIPHKIFILWLWWFFKGLKFEYLVRILDCYLLDGIKALYRFALTILSMYSKHLETASQHHHHHPHHKQSNEEEDQRDPAELLVLFLMEHPICIEKFIKDSYNIKNLTSAYIQQKMAKAEEELKNLPDLDSFLELQLSEPGLDMSIVQEARGLPPIGLLKTELVGPKEIEHFWNWIPLRLTTYLPHLIYSSNEDGCSLTAFFRKVDPWAPSLLIIRNDNNEVFGAYCSDSWRRRHEQKEANHYFGTGESFLFTLQPKIQIFPWKCRKPDESPGTADHSSLIMSAQTNGFILLGGGGKGPALMLDASLAHGQTHACDTFCNPPLCSENYFRCNLVEVIGFKDKGENIPVESGSAGVASFLKECRETPSCLNDSGSQ